MFAGWDETVVSSLPSMSNGGVGWKMTQYKVSVIGTSGGQWDSLKRQLEGEEAPFLLGL